MMGWKRGRGRGDEVAGQRRNLKGGRVGVMLCRCHIRFTVNTSC